jgi:hypothetical protein
VSVAVGVQGVQGVQVLAREHHSLAVCVMRYDQHPVLLLADGDDGYFVGDDYEALVVQNLLVLNDRVHLSKHREDYFC